MNDEIRQKSEKFKLEKSHDLLRALFDSSLDAFLIANDEACYVDANVAACEMLGYEREELLRMSVWDVTPEPSAAARQLWREFIAGGRQSGEYQVRQKNGNLREVEYRAVANILPGLHLSVLRDVSRRKQAEEALLDLNAELDERVQARTKELEVLNQVLQLEISEREQIEAELAELQRHLMDRVEAEQMSLARELHDGPMQDLLATSYRIAKLQENHPEMSQILDGLKDDILRTNQALRNVSQDLRPASLMGFGLEAAIREYAGRYQETNPELQIQLKIGAINDELAGAVNLALFRIYQVAINNILRHAQASRAEVRLALNGNQVILEIEDDGRGFEVPERWIELARKGHLGLVGAKERADAVGGKLEVVSQPGKGTVIRVVAPVEK